MDCIFLFPNLCQWAPLSAMGRSVKVYLTRRSFPTFDIALNNFSCDCICFQPLIHTCPLQYYMKSLKAFHPLNFILNVSSVFDKLLTIQPNQLPVHRPSDITQYNEEYINLLSQRPIASV